MTAIPAVDKKKSRVIYDCQTQGSTFLPGKLLRKEGIQSPRIRRSTKPTTASGATYDFYKTLFGRTRSTTTACS
jgi:hypothetical protein